jgi:hypothetical protein
MRDILCPEIPLSQMKSDGDMEAVNWQRALSLEGEWVTSKSRNPYIVGDILFNYYGLIPII